MRAHSAGAGSSAGALGFPSWENPERVRRALIRFGAPVEELSIEDRRRVEIGGLRVPVLSREHLIQNKRATGRPQDLADLARLERREGG